MHKLFRYHPRLWLAFGLGAALFLLAPGAWPALLRLLVAWDSGVALFLVLVNLWMTRLSARQIRARYAEEDPTAAVILSVVTLAAILSLIAILALLSNRHHTDPGTSAVDVGLAALTIIESWLLVATMFTLHYADTYYSVPPEQAPLAFPKTAEPVFWDFAYFSLTIAAACQTSDVSTHNAAIRRVVIAQTLVSFIFNVSILGFAINVSAGLVGT